MNGGAVARILVADDEPTSRLLMQAALEQAGFEVVTAVDGEFAIQEFNAARFDLVMLDVEMPNMDGYQACTLLRRQGETELPVLMVTGMDDVESIRHAFEAGATDFLAKPINWSLIGHRVRYLLRSANILAELRQANARNSAIIDALPDLLFDVDVDGRCLDCHAPRNAVMSLAPAEIIGRSVTDLLPTMAATLCMAALDDARITGYSSGTQLQLETARGTVWFELSISRKNTANNPRLNFLVLARDITERKEAEKRIARLAYFDSLTGLPNRVSFQERLERDLSRAKFRHTRLAVLFLDLDGFKNVNDTLGHMAGDKILQDVAERLRLGVRTVDMVSRPQAIEGVDFDAADTRHEIARLGGDEFTVLITELHNTGDALLLAQRIIEMMRLPFNVGEREIILTTSIGIAVHPDDGDSADALLRMADTAMYHAKNSGRNNFQFYNQDLTHQAMQRLNLESNLRLALQRDEFFLVYQPQLDVKTSRVLSVEALIRWQHPELGLISPLDFIPLAEETGLIIPIGEWVIRTACAQVQQWHAEGHFVRVAVNLSPAQFKNSHLVASITEILDCGLNAQWLELEVTEGALMDDFDTSLVTLTALRHAGIRIALDDFGTGYSSLSYLQRLPLDTIKVDQSFVRDFLENDGSLAIVRAIVTLAKNLGFTVTAEGVETLEQAQRLQSMACESLQGYYFSRPVKPNDIPAMLNRDWTL